MKAATSAANKVNPLVENATVFETSQFLRDAQNTIVSDHPILDSAMKTKTYQDIPDPDAPAPPPELLALGEEELGLRTVKEQTQVRHWLAIQPPAPPAGRERRYPQRGMLRTPFMQAKYY